jgi:hypothetical protein
MAVLAIAAILGILLIAEISFLLARNCYSLVIVATF